MELYEIYEPLDTDEHIDGIDDDTLLEMMSKSAWESIDWGMGGYDV